MFTGIVESTGTVQKVHLNGELVKLEISHPTLFAQPALGSSIAVNGVCLTQAQYKTNTSIFDVVSETLNKTNLGALKEGDVVNLELSLKYGDRVDGHLVQGHVDGLCELVEIDDDKSEIWIKLSSQLKTYFVQKGSIALDGISLTVAEIQDDLIRIALVPTTWNKTHLRLKKKGDFLNVEVDILAKQIHKYMKNYNPENAGAYT